MNTPAIAARQWIDPFDRWHLLILPPALIIVGILLVALPKPQPAPSGGTHRFHPGMLSETPRLPIPAPASPLIQAPAPTAPVTSSPTLPSTAQRFQPGAPVQSPLRPTRIESPSPNALFWRDRLGDVEGTAEPGSVVQLVLGQKQLARTTADVDGRYRFRLAGFPPGQFRLQVVASAAPNRQSTDSVTFTVKAEASPKAKPQPSAQPQSKTPVKAAPNKSTPQKSSPAKSKPAAAKPAGKSATKSKPAPASTTSTNSASKPNRKPATTRPSP